MIVAWRQLTSWPASELTAKRRSRAYRARLSDSRALLKFEAAKLDAIGIIIAVGFPAHHFIDYRLKIDGKSPTFPGVVVALDTPRGSFRFACDRHTKWTANLHAIAITLRRLRELTAHGVADTKRIYIPWRIDGPRAADPQRPPPPPPPPPRDPPTQVERAAEFIATHSGGDRQQILRDAQAARAAYLQASLKLHPDRGGTHQQFVELQQAWSLIKTRHGL